MEGVDGADLLTLHEQGLLPLGEGGTDEGEGDDLEEYDEEEEAPQLVEFPGVGVGRGLDTENGAEEGGSIGSDEERGKEDEGGGVEMEVGDDDENQGSEGSEMEEEEDVREEVEEEDGAEGNVGGEKDGTEEGQDVGGVEGKATKRVCRSKKRGVKGSECSRADEAVEEASTSKV